MTGQVPSVGRAVHYVSRGSADGVYPPECRAATITEVGTDPETAPHLVGLCVINPTGLFFRPIVDGGAAYDAGHPDGPGGLCTGYGHAPGTWHWPARV